MGNMPYFDILILAMIAVFILNRLRNVLGKKTGEEPNGSQKLHLGEKDYNESKPDNESYKKVADDKDNDLQHFHEDKDINFSLNEIRKIENKFDMEDFIDKAKKAFEFILKAYSENNIKLLETLLEKELFLEYKKDITSRVKKKELFDGRDLNATLDARSVYASAMSTVFDLEFKSVQKDVFWGEDLQNLSDKLFKA